jgi:hypothetical protein
MAEWFTPTDEQRREWDAWCAERPPGVREIAERCPPWKLFRLTTSGHRVYLRSIQEHDDGPPTVTVAVDEQFNAVMFSRQVFGIDPASLVECGYCPK